MKSREDFELDLVSKTILPIFFLLFASSCQAGPRQIEGYYRFGHEVNTVCTGEPEACYWLVDTAPEIRDELKQRVAGQPPYTPVCLKLIAELSAKKADGFGRDYDGSVSVQQVIGPCAGEDSAMIQLKDLTHRRWVLRRIDGLDLADYAVHLGFDAADTPRKIPELDFGEDGHVSGNTGCNQLQGKVSVEDSRVVFSPLASTRMACPGFAGELELRLNQLYAAPLDAVIGADSLTLTDGDIRLEYELKDWVN